MVLHSVYRLSFVCILIGFAFSQRKNPDNDPWFGYSRGDSGSVGSMSPGGEQDAAGTWNLRPDRPFPQMAWTSAHVPLGMVEQRPLHPSSYVVQTGSGYQRTRDSSSDAKYTQDISGHIPLPEPHKVPGFKDRKI